MKCNSCGMIVDGNWKYCPNCSKKIKDNKKVFIILSIVLILVICFGVFAISKKNAPIDDNYLMKSLSKKYDEKFSEISYVKSMDIPDRNLDCDGSSFGTIKTEGTKEYYKVYSESNDIEFFVYYYTAFKNKEVYDTYENYLNRRESLLKIYDITKEYLGENIIKFSISYDSYDESIEISSKSQLNNILSNFKDEDISNYTSSGSFGEKIYITINEDIYEFSKNNYSTIKEINNEIVKLKNEYDFSMEILLNDNAEIVFDKELYVHASNGYNAKGEKFDNFVMRTKY